MNRWVATGLLLATVIAISLRGPALERRPMHNDEGVNAIKFGQLWDGHGYKYDHNEHHGPSLYYASWLVCRLSGAPGISQISDARLKAVTVVFGVALLLLLPLTTDGLGRRATVWAGLFVAVSPALVFYSRYYIHETILVFATFLSVGAGWRYWRTRQIGWAILAGIGLGLMHTTKETFVLTLAAAAFGLGANQFWNRYLDASGTPVHAPRINYLHLLTGLTAWLLVWFLLFSSFFTNFTGLTDSVRTYFPWLRRAGGESPHINPWYFYFERLLYFARPKSPTWTEALLLFLALIGGWAGFARKRLGQANASFVRFLLLFSCALTVIYTVISYKTPWCLMTFWFGFVLLAGVGAAVLVRDLKPKQTRWAVALLLVAGAGHLAWQSWQQSTTYADDRRNPYVYAQTSADIYRLVSKVIALGAAHPDGSKMLIKTIAPDSDYWPLPWYLRRFQNLGWWDALPQDPYAPVMIVSSRLDAQLDEKKTHLMVGLFQLRPEVFLELYVELNLWKAYLEKNPPPTQTE